MTGFGADLLGWTPTALLELAELRGWTEYAIERLELGWLPDQARVELTVRDELGGELGLLRYDPTGHLTPKMLAGAGTPRSLFPPPEMIADQELDELRTVFLVEGEPDAIRLWSLGLVAVGVPGAGNWRDEWAARFTGRHLRVVVCFDCDEAGRAGAQRAAAAIAAAGVDARLLDLDPTRDDGYDLTDWSRGARTVETRAQAAASLTAIADQLELYRLERDRPWRSLPWSTFRDTAPTDHRWLIDGLLPAGMLCFVAGPPKRGKTWIGISIAIALATGRPLAGVHEVPDPVDVLYLALEGSATGLRARIGALARGAGVDPDGQELERLHMLYRPRPFDLAEIATSDWLLDEAVDVGAQLVVIDVLRAAARFQENVAEDFARIREHLDPLLLEARTVALLHHFGKLNEMQKERSPGERMAGTGAMYGALDVGLLLTRSENGARRLRVDVEARDFAAPDALELVIAGEGTGTHGGFRYVDTATLEVAPPEDDEVDLELAIVQLLEEGGEWRTRDELASALGIGWRSLEAPLAAAVDAGRLVRVSGEEVGRRKTARPYGTPAMANSVQPGPSQPSLLGELGPETSVPLTGDRDGPRSLERPSAGATEQELDDELEARRRRREDGDEEPA